ncbi:MAG: hypothetical protein P4N41_17200 [Negativicutes bacterium]|nr:hypothetical protein [Negativicutes bacterium]
MRFSRLMRLTWAMVTVLLIIGSVATAAAGANIQWYTSGVYYDGSGRLVITGYFKNEGTVTIDKINWVTLNVNLQRSDGTWWLAYSDTWHNIDIVLQPGQTYPCNLQSSETRQFRFQGFRVTGTINYHVVTGSDA